MFVKLFNQILDSSIADNRRLRHFFTDLLLCADMRGYVVMTESAIARRIGTTLDEVEWGISELEKPDPRSKTPDNEGCRIEKLEGSGYGWRIINFETYRLLKSAEEMREKTKERVRKFREKKKLQLGNADVTQCNAGNTIQRQIQKQKKSEKEEAEEHPLPLDFAQSKPDSPHRRATFEQVMKMGRGQMPPISEECCEKFFDRMQADGWINKQGFPLNDWRARFREWAGAWSTNAANPNRNNR